MADLLLQSSTAQPLVFLMVQNTDHTTGLTGASPTVTLSKSGGSFASPSGAVTEIANGWYKVAGNATDTNTLGPLILHATATGGDPADREYNVVAYNPQDSAALGLTLMPSNVTQIGSSSTAATNLKSTYAAFETGTAQAGAASTITLRSGAVATDAFYASQAIFIMSGTGAGQTNKISSYVGATKVATVETAWATQPDNTSVYLVLGRIG